MGLRIMIVEDGEPDATELMRAWLRMVGCEARVVAGMPAALHVLERERVDMVLTGLSVDGGSGAALCAMVSSRHPKIPVIVVTADAKPETGTIAKRAGAAAVLTKPVQLDRLRRRIRRLTN